MSGMNMTPSGERVHIAFFGRRNAGKSSLVNAFTGQDLALVSEVKGTTTDPVYKAMELLPMGPVMIIDTPGMDDEGTLGEMRVQRARKVLDMADVAIVVTDATQPLRSEEEELLELIRIRRIPCVLVRNKADLLAEVPDDGLLYVSALTGFQVEALKNQVASLDGAKDREYPLVGDLLSPEDVVVLVIPIDKAAPKGRLILPQQQVIRDVLEAGASALVCRDTELTEVLSRLSEDPRMVITDSQVFRKVSAIVPQHIPLTSFSILMARHKGDLSLTVSGSRALDSLGDGDKVLISEGCTHHRQCGDIGTQKLPQWIQGYTGKQLEFSFTSGRDFPEDLGEYALVVHCGGCMLTGRQMTCRQKSCIRQGVPVTNYGIAISRMNGILERATAMFPEI